MENKKIEIKKEYIMHMMSAVGMLDVHSVEKVKSVEAGLNKTRKDKMAYGCHFDEREYVVIGRKKFYSDYKSHPKTYIFGEVVTREELEQGGEHETLVLLMKKYEHTKLVRTRLGNFQPYIEGETVVLEK